MTMNPLHYIDALLADWTSARVRRSIHTLLLLAASLAGIWLAAEGNWVEAIGAVLALIYAESNRANTYAVVDEDDGDEYDEVEYEDGYPEDVETTTDLVSGNARSDLSDEDDIATEGSVSQHARPLDQ